jgi:hypothetical protein
VTLPEILVVLVVFYMVFRPQPKKGKKPNAQRKPLPRRGPFRPKDNPFKVYRQPDQGMVASAYQRRKEHLASPGPCEEAFNDILKSIGLIENRDYERESICFYPGSYVLFDFFFKSRKLAFEIDGKVHQEPGQLNHDKGRDAYFARRGVRIVRISNNEVLKHVERVKVIVSNALAQ